KFMEDALKNQPAIPFRVPPGLRLVRVDPATGRPPRAGARGAILEAFLPGTVPTRRGQVLDGSGDRVQPVGGQPAPGRKLRDLY
ncbi:MAG: hypothetical protein HOI96_07535, partial [Rhodospirillaceae bacterium]|nr:hypothetical protein [Rhodospirillaceae bacterium]